MVLTETAVDQGDVLLASDLAANDKRIEHRNPDHAGIAELPGTTEEVLRHVALAICQGPDRVIGIQSRTETNDWSSHGTKLPVNLSNE
jgi:hypothetical protein